MWGPLKGAQLLFYSLQTFLCFSVTNRQAFLHFVLNTSFWVPWLQQSSRFLLKYVKAKRTTNKKLKQMWHRRFLKMVAFSAFINQSLSNYKIISIDLYYWGLCTGGAFRIAIGLGVDLTEWWVVTPGATRTPASLQHATLFFNFRQKKRLTFKRLALDKQQNLNFCFLKKGHRFEVEGH